MRNFIEKRELGKRSVVLFALLFFMLFSVSCGKETEPVAKEQHQEEASEEEFVEKWQEGTVFHNGKSYRYDAGIKTYLFLGIDKDGKVETVSDGIDGGQSDALFLLVVDEKDGKQPLMNDPQPTNVGWGFCYAASRHEPADSLDPAEQGMSTMPLSHWVTFGNTFLKMFPAPLISALVMVPS